ncbi:hypothetical protein ABIB90_005398 [Bradyrhizobium sp. JR4.1]|jgi:hypothetical protein|nr:hypothetical protein Bra1253DRAFT_04103 [Bradyrhizobium sp. WSM1253]
MITERRQPTLWPRSLEDELRMERALHSLEKENKDLKELVVRLSETLLRHVCQSAALRSLKNSAERNTQGRTDPY